MAAPKSDRGLSASGRVRARRANPDRGEFALIEQVRAAVAKIGHGRGVIVGIGDDCAVVELPRGERALRTVLTTDSMIEGVHFRAGWLTPRELGVRAFRAAVSDVAAMGARPRFALLSLELPPEGFGAREALALVRGLATDARRAGATLVGGNVTSAPRAGVTVTVVGEASRPVLRSGARPGDFVFVTGRFGGAAAGWKSLASPGSAKASTAAWRRPPLRLDFAASLADRGIAHAMIDVSDGLLQDLGHVAESSRVAIRLDTDGIPIHSAARRLAAGEALRLALCGGEDYELAFTAPERSADAIELLALEHRVPVAVVGVVEKGRAEVTDLARRPFPIEHGGFDHLRPRAAGANVRTRTRNPR